MNGAGATGTILAAELRALRNRIAKRGAARAVLLGVFLVLGAVFIGGSAFTAGASVAHFLPSSVDPVLAGGFTVLSVLMLVLGFPTVIATFFVGRDLLQLVIAPVRTAEIFAARLVLAMSANMLISAVLLAAVLGLGFGAGAPLIYFPLAALLILVQVLVITALQAILMTVILRWVPARLARDVAAAVAGLTGAGFYLAWNFSLRRSLPRGGGRPDLSGLTTFVQRIDWLPSSWPAHALSSVLASDAEAAVLWGAAAFILAALMVATAEFLYERTLLAGLGVFGSTPVVWRRKAPREGAPRLAPGTGSPIPAIARKDWLAFRRDIRRLARLLPALLLPIGYAVALSQPSRSLSGFWANVFLVGFLSLFMSSALATAAIPSERRGFQLLRLAPLTMAQVLRAKVLLTLPPVLAVMLIFSSAVSIVSGSGPIQLLELALLAVWLGCGFVAISVSAGGIDPRFEAIDDRRSVGLVGTLTSLFGSLGFGALSVGAFALFVLGAAAAGGGAHLGPIPSTAAVGAVMWVIGLVLVGGALVLVGSLLRFADVRLSAFEATISER